MRGQPPERSGLPGCGAQAVVRAAPRGPASQAGPQSRVGRGLTRGEQRPEELRETVLRHLEGGGEGVSAAWLQKSPTQDSSRGTGEGLQVQRGHRGEKAGPGAGPEPLKKRVLGRL